MPANGPNSISLSQVRRPLLAHPKLILEWQRVKSQVNLLRNWWLRRHAPYQPLFIIATCHSGSDRLLTYLNQQPGIAALGEVLSRQLPSGPRHDCISPSTVVSHIRYCLQGETTPVRGCTLMIDQLANCRLTLNDLHAAFPTAKYIVFYRQSLAEQFISLKLADTTRNEEPKQAQITVKAAELRKYCDDIRRGHCEVLKHAWLADQAALLSHEELAANATHCLQKHICPLLGIEFTPPPMRLRKQVTQPLAEHVANYREVAPLLQSPLCRQHHHRETQRTALPRAA